MVSNPLAGVGGEETRQLPIERFGRDKETWRDVASLWNKGTNIGKRAEFATLTSFLNHGRLPDIHPNGDGPYHNARCQENV